MKKAKILFVEDEMISAAALEDGVSPFLRNFGSVIIGILILFGLYLSSLYNFLLFHTLAELFIILVSWAIFIIVWNCRRITSNSYFIFLGIAYLFIGGLELIHTLAYKGMDIFTEYDANLPTQLWIAARYMESISFLVAPLFFHRRLKVGLCVMVYALATVFVLGAVFYWHIFPACFVEGVGLTPFKKISEYIISFILLGAFIFLFQNREEMDKTVFHLVAVSIIVSIATELAFTFYISVYGFSNLMGHFLKLVATYLIYKAMIETALVKPYALLFKKLHQQNQDQKKSIREKEILLSEIHHRVKNNMQVIISLLKLQAGKLVDEQHADIFKDSENRIRSMALVHENLYQTKDFANINFSQYVKTVSNLLFGSYSISPDRVSLNMEIEDVSLGLDHAIPCGLIINELISNSLKYAFPKDRKGEIKIALRSTNDHEVELTVSDDGIGIPDGVDIQNAESMGLQLVHLLAENQLDGKMEIDCVGGTKFQIRFENHP